MKTKTLVILIGLFSVFSSASAQQGAQSPEILAALSPDAMQAMSATEISKTRGEQVRVKVKTKERCFLFVCVGGEIEYRSYWIPTRVVPLGGGRYRVYYTSY